MKINEDRLNVLVNAFILIGMLTAVTVIDVCKLQQPGSRVFMLMLASVGTLTGVLNTVLSANGNIMTFLFGVIDVSIASVVAFDSSIRPDGDPVWGNFALHAFYFLPMQFIGWKQWKKRGAAAGSKVKARRLSAWGAGCTAAALTAGTALSYAVLCMISGNSVTGIHTVILMDAAVFMLNILGQILMSLAYMEQWLIWLAVNIFSIALWSGKALSSAESSYTAVMVIKYAFYLLNSLNGLRIWYKLSSTPSADDVLNEKVS